MEPRGANPAPDETGTSRKKQIFASALKRMDREIKRVEEAERPPDPGRERAGFWR